MTDRVEHPVEAGCVDHRLVHRVAGRLIDGILSSSSPWPSTAPCRLLIFRWPPAAALAEQALRSQQILLVREFERTQDALPVLHVRLAVVVRLRDVSRVLRQLLGDLLPESRSLVEPRHEISLLQACE